MKGFFKPKHLSKYKGNPTNIIYRSSLELKYMCKLDDDPKVLQWSSEEIWVPYHDKATNRHRRYFPDFWVRTSTDQFLVEIKPAVQCKAPTNKKRKTYLTEVRTYITNISKWEAARRFAKIRGMTFIIITDKDLMNL